MSSRERDATRTDSPQRTQRGTAATKGVALDGGRTGSPQSTQRSQRVLCVLCGESSSAFSEEYDARLVETRVPPVLAEFFAQHEQFQG